MPDYAGRHLRFGWWSLLVFATFGLILEGLHGFKVRLYLDVSNETRRLLWTLAHAHGLGLGVVHVLFGLMVRGEFDLAPATLRRISWSLISASILLPGGFFLGGVSFYSGDPGLGIVLVPAGAIVLLTAIVSIARGIGARSPAEAVSSTAPARRLIGRVRHGRSRRSEV